MQSIILQATNINNASNYLPIGIQLFFAIGFIATMMLLTHSFGPKERQQKSCKISKAVSK
jgi:NADH-quinone oxidoreductase subunit A